MSEPLRPYGDPNKRPKPEPELERPDLKVLRELAESKSSGTASTPTSELEDTSSSSGSGPKPYTPLDE